MLALPSRGGATRLLLIRHAETSAGMRGRCYGRLDVPASPAGRRQAAALGEALAATPLVAVYSSPLARAMETAAPIGAAQGLEVVPVDGLREIDFGELEGLTYDEIRARRPALYREWMEHPARVRFPAGESFAELRERAVPALTTLRERHAGEAVAVVTHGGVVRAALADVLELGDGAVFRLGLDHCSVSVVDWADGAPVVRAVNTDLYSRR
jgi:broad specificity phosphatase PhoE